jgi:hypothetical protein
MIRSTMTYNPATYYGELKRKLWTGTLILDVLFLVAVACFSAKQLEQAVGGVLMGIFYLWSLTFNAEHPKKAIQFAFSLIRVCLLAYLVVQLSHLRVYELAIVICGLLSYKFILTVEYVVQALQVFRSPVSKSVSAP